MRFCVKRPDCGYACDINYLSTTIGSQADLLRFRQAERFPSGGPGPFPRRARQACVPPGILASKSRYLPRAERTKPIDLTKRTIPR
jgi:hypothetical protein